MTAPAFRTSLDLVVMTVRGPTRNRRAGARNRMAGDGGEKPFGQTRLPPKTQS